MSEHPVTITLKAGSDYSSPWIVFNGDVDSVKENIGATFGVAAGDLNLGEITVAAAAHFQGLKAASTLAETPEKNAASRKEQPAPQAEELPDTPVSLEERVKQAASVDEINRLWKANRSPKKWTPQVDELAKARVAELKESEAA